MPRHKCHVYDTNKPPYCHWVVGLLRRLDCGSAPSVCHIPYFSLHTVHATHEQWLSPSSQPVTSQHWTLHRIPIAVLCIMLLWTDRLCVTLWGRTGGSGPPTPGVQPPTPAQIFPPYPRPLFSPFFFGYPRPKFRFYEILRKFPDLRWNTSSLNMQNFKCYTVYMFIFQH